MLKRLTIIGVALIAVLVACGIPDNGQVASIQSKDLRQLGDTIPPTTTSTIPPTTIVPTTTTTIVDTATTIATDDVTLYFISGGQLKGYPRVAGQAGDDELSVLGAAGGPPPGDLGVGMRSAVPTERAGVDHGNRRWLRRRHDRAAARLLRADSAGRPAAGDRPDRADRHRGRRHRAGAVHAGRIAAAGARGPSGELSDGTEPLSRRDYQELLNPPSPDDHHHDDDPSPTTTV